MEENSKYHDIVFRYFTKLFTSPKLNLHFNQKEIESNFQSQMKPLISSHNSYCKNFNKNFFIFLISFILIMWISVIYSGTVEPIIHIQNSVGLSVVLIILSTLISDTASGIFTTNTIITKHYSSEMCFMLNYFALNMNCFILYYFGLNLRINVIIDPLSLISCINVLINNMFINGSYKNWTLILNSSIIMIFMKLILIILIIQFDKTSNELIKYLFIKILIDILTTLNAYLFESEGRRNFFINYTKTNEIIYLKEVINSMKQGYISFRKGKMYFCNDFTEKIYNFSPLSYPSKNIPTVNRAIRNLTANERDWISPTLKPEDMTKEKDDINGLDSNNIKINPQSSYTSEQVYKFLEKIRKLNFNLPISLINYFYDTKIIHDKHPNHGSFGGQSHSMTFNSGPSEEPISNRFTMENFEQIIEENEKFFENYVKIGNISKDIISFNEPEYYNQNYDEYELLMRYSSTSKLFSPSFNNTSTETAASNECDEHHVPKNLIEFLLIDQTQEAIKNKKMRKSSIHQGKVVQEIRKTLGNVNSLTNIIFEKIKSNSIVNNNSENIKVINFSLLYTKRITVLANFLVQDSNLHAILNQTCIRCIPINQRLSCNDCRNQLKCEICFSCEYCTNKENRFFNFKAQIGKVITVMQTKLLLEGRSIEFRYKDFIKVMKDETDETKNEIQEDDHISAVSSMNYGVGNRSKINSKIKQILSHKIYFISYLFNIYQSIVDENINKYIDIHSEVIEQDDKVIITIDILSATTIEALVNYAEYSSPENFQIFESIIQSNSFTSSNNKNNHLTVAYILARKLKSHSLLIKKNNNNSTVYRIIITSDIKRDKQNNKLTGLSKSVRGNSSHESSKINLGPFPLSERRSQSFYNNDDFYSDEKSFIDESIKENEDRYLCFNLKKSSKSLINLIKEFEGQKNSQSGDFRILSPKKRVTSGVSGLGLQCFNISQLIHESEDDDSYSSYSSRQIEKSIIGASKLKIYENSDNDESKRSEIDGEMIKWSIEKEFLENKNKTPEIMVANSITPQSFPATELISFNQPHNNSFDSISLNDKTSTFNPRQALKIQNTSTYEQSLSANKNSFSQAVSESGSKSKFNTSQHDGSKNLSLNFTFHNENQPRARHSPRQSDESEIAPFNAPSKSPPQNKVKRETCPIPIISIVNSDDQPDLQLKDNMEYILEQNNDISQNNYNGDTEGERTSNNNHISFSDNSTSNFFGSPIIEKKTRNKSMKKVSLFKNNNSLFYKSQIQDISFYNKDHGFLDNNISQKKDYLITKNVLIIEDERLIRNSLHKTFDRFSKVNEIWIEVCEGNNGFEGLDLVYKSLISNKKLDLIVCDEIMPFMKGSCMINLLKNMMKTGQLYDIQIICYTSLEDIYSQEYLESQGADYILTKPMNFDKFSEILSKVFNLKHYGLKNSN